MPWCSAQEKKANRNFRPEAECRLFIQTEDRSLIVS
jgi:hypothetical protein